MIHYDEYAIQLIEREIINIYDTNAADYPHSTYLLEIRKRLLDKQALTRETQEELLPDIIAFNDALHDALKSMYDRAHELYRQKYAIMPDIKVTAKCYLACDYPALHPYRGEDRQDLFEAICDSGWNRLYEDGVTSLLELPRDIEQSFDSFIGMDCKPDNWNERLDKKLTKDLHLINAFHNLFDHTNFALTDFIFCRDFDFEYSIDYTEKTTLKNKTHMKTFARKNFKDEYGVEFSTCCNITTLTRMPTGLKGAYRIPDFVANIGLCAIKGCNELTSVVIPKSVTVIEKDNFELCEQLTSLIVEPGNPMFDSRDNCNAIIVTATNTLVSGCNGSTIPDGVEVIADSAFSQRRNLSHISIPDSVVYIGEFAFLGCFSLESEIALQGIRQVTRSCFDGCSDLKKITIGSGIESVEAGAFAGCAMLSNVEISEGTKNIGTYAFDNCNSLVSIALPKSIERIESTAFDRCNRIERVLIPQGTMDYFMRFDALKQYRHRFVPIR